MIVRRGGWGGRARGAGGATSIVRRLGGHQGGRLKKMLALCANKSKRGVGSTFGLGVLLDVFSDLRLPA